MKKLTLILLSGSLFTFAACASKAKPAAKAGDLKAPVATKAVTKETKPAASTPSESATKDGITVVKSVACRSVEKRNPVGEASTFPSDVGKVYLFTQLKSASGSTSIQHIWYHNNKKMGEVTLPVNGTSWRTFSKKSVDSSLKGDWKVDVTTSKGDVLQTTSFKVE